MAPFRHHTAVTVLSTQVVSHDEQAILVESGSFTPMRWFLERGHTTAHEADDNDEMNPPSKRRKLSKKIEAPVHNISTQKSEEEAIPLAKVHVDMHFPENLHTEPVEANDISRTANVDFLDTVEVPVVSYSVAQDSTGLQLRLAHRALKGAVIKIDTGPVADEILNALQSLVLPDRQKVSFGNTKTNDRPASIFKCSLRRSMGGTTNVVRLEMSICWRDGYSAFPAGAPVGRERIYADYDLYAQYFPDHDRQQVDHTQPWTPQDFYESVYVPDKDSTPEFANPINAGLYPFQKRAVQWMLKREGVEIAAEEVQCISTSEREKLDVNFYQQGRDADGETCYCNPLQGIIARVKPKPGANDLSGGLLAEEMGLGKTVEIMALLSLHQRKDTPVANVHDVESDTTALPSKATLIITPSSILHQWQSELSRHAPSLKVCRYDGVSSGLKKSMSEQEWVQSLTEVDVVLATYQTLAKEVHFATAPPERNMRHARQYERKRSPLIQIQWWRVCLDEAQMVESGVTAAARVARRLPRVHSWAVSGTPVKKNVQDLHGLLIFLRLKPFDENPKVWGHLITNHRHQFRKIFKTIALRHTKAQIREDIQLPAQKRVVVTIPFTAIENQHYSTLFGQMCDDVGLTADGSPKSEHWNPEDTQTIENMRTWLIRLRQTCLHPQVGGRNRKALGRGQGPLRTVAEVLEVMIEQNETTTRFAERAAIQAQLKRAHIFGNARRDEHRSEKALELYKLALDKSALIVQEARDRLHTARTTGLIDDVSAETDDEDSSSETTPLIGRLRNNLRIALQLQHVCTYFAATSNYQIKINEALTAPDSDDFKRLETKEVELYDFAKALRREILQDASRKSEYLMHKIIETQRSGALTNMPLIKDLKSLGGIESRRLVEKSDDLFDVIRQQTPYIIEWRAKIIKILTQSLVDEDTEGNEITGDEYETSTKQQDELYVYFDVVKVMQADLNTFITGESAPLLDHEAKTLINLAKRWLDPDVPLEMKSQPHAPELLLELSAIRQQFRTEVNRVGSIRGLIAEARNLLDNAQLGGSRHAAEGGIAQQHLNALQSVLTSYTKALNGLDKEIDLFRSTQNQRLEFYRQLQEVSDDVAPYKEEMDDELDMDALQRAFEEEESHKSTLAQFKTKHRFLMHLKDEAGAQDTPRVCVICQCTFENGVLTVCGHQYCKECIQHWWNQHRTCPVCKRRLALVDLHNITYKPRALKVHEEVQSGTTSPGDLSSSSTPSTRQTSIYSEVEGKLLDQIKSVDLPSSYGTKIDTLARHLLWLREHDPGSKSIVFSQFREFLDVLGTAFSDFRIGYARLGKSGAVEQFRRDPSIDCLLLDAKTDSSGLTLVNATHVLICEPLINTAVELQAVARVHRIGQTRPTTVWMYLVNDTVEESIYEISVARRLAHVQSRETSKRSEKSRSTTPAPLGEQAIDAANSEEMQSAPLSVLLTAGKGGGERVGKGDLWQCLFGKAKAAMDADTQVEFNRKVRAQAAKQRAVPALVSR